MASRKRGRPFGSDLTLSQRKAKRQALDRERSREKVYIGTHFQRWNRVKEELNLVNQDFAGFLLDRYEESKQQRVVSSTPVHAKRAGISHPYGISDISSAESGKASDPVISGVEEMEKEPGPSISHKAKGAKYSTSFFDPLEITIDFSEETEYSEESGDETYEPSFNISLGPRYVEGIQDCPSAETVFPGCIEEEDDNNEEAVEEESETLISRVLSLEDIPHLTEDKTAIVYLSQLTSLANKKVGPNCKVKGCDEAIEIAVHHIGSAVYLKWICSNSHVADKWCSQPVLRKGLHGGDLMIASSILFSGNNFNKMELFAKFLKMGFLSQSSFTRLQRRYLVPSVDDLWSEKQEEMNTELADKDLVLLGDGRMDSPGHSAQFCTYTFMENSSKKIVCVNTLDKREADKKSVNLEKAGFIRGLAEIQEHGLTVSEVVTDAHLQIGALMKKDYPVIKHSHDIWHAAKNLGKKLLMAGQDKRCRDLQKWAGDIVNHFWFTCQSANTLEDFMGMWVGVLHHVVGEHEWLLPYSDTGTSACAHDPITGEVASDKEYLEKGGPAHEALRNVILNKRFLNNIPYYLNFRSTSELESFHNHMLMYSSKRYSYTPPVYRARSILAALDYNNNINRQPIINKDGTQRLQRTYNKKSGRWTVYPVKEKKSYEHVNSLLRKVIMKRLDDREGFHGRMELEIGDPRRLSRTVAPKNPPPTAELAEEKKSRFATQET